MAEDNATEAAMGVEEGLTDKQTALIGLEPPSLKVMGMEEMIYFKRKIRGMNQSYMRRTEILE